MRTKFFTLMIASMTLAHCGSEDKSEGGDWNEPTTETKEEEKAEPAQPATANTDEKKNKSLEPPAASPPASAKTGEKAETAKAAEPDVKSPIRKITDTPIRPGWELMGPDDTGIEWHIKIAYVSTKGAIVKIDKAYTEVVPGKTLKYLGQRSVVKTRVVQSAFTFYEPGMVTTTTIDFVRNEDDGECYATYKVDGTFSSSNVTMTGKCP